MQEDIRDNMYKEQPGNDGGLAVMYTFKAGDISKATNGKVRLPAPATSPPSKAHDAAAQPSHSTVWRRYCGCPEGLHTAPNLMLTLMIEASQAPAEWHLLPAQASIREARGSQDNKLELWGDAPRYEYSSVPLMNQDGTRPVKTARAGDRGHALMLNDKQVRTAPVVFLGPYCTE